jgi:hypothetical protein
LPLLTVGFAYAKTCSDPLTVLVGYTHASIHHEPLVVGSSAVFLGTVK